MQYRSFGRLGWSVGEIGYGMWGLAGWTGSDDDETTAALERAVAAGLQLLRHRLGVRQRPERTGCSAASCATIPDMNSSSPPRCRPRTSSGRPAASFSLDDCFPPEHIREYAEKSLANLDLPRIDLLQFHVWEDAWARDERWQRAIDDLKRQGLIRGAGVSVNRWEPTNVIETLQTGLIDAVQVIYNIFDQSPEDELFPLCRELDVAVIARVPFDEGTLTGTLTQASRWPEGDWRNSYFRAGKPRAERRTSGSPPAARAGGDDDARARPALDSGRANRLDDHSGNAQSQARRANLAASDGRALEPSLLEQLKAHRWDRTPTDWSQ